MPHLMQNSYKHTVRKERGACPNRAYIPGVVASHHLDAASVFPPSRNPSLRAVSFTCVLLSFRPLVCNTSDTGPRCSTALLVWVRAESRVFESRWFTLAVTGRLLPWYSSFSCPLPHLENALLQLFCARHNVYHLSLGMHSVNHLSH
jgi:hypothetical protein